MNKWRNKAKQHERNSSVDEARETDDHLLESDDEQVAILVRVVPPWLVSMLVHIALILVLAILTLTSVVDDHVSLTVDAVNDVEEFTEITVLEFDELDLEQDSSMESMIDAEEELSATQEISPVSLNTTDVFEKYYLCDTRSFL